MRFFPSAARRRASLGCLAAVSIATLAVPASPLSPANADQDDDLKARQKAVQGQIDQAADDLREASKTATRAARRLQATQARLATARETLADVTTRLAAARERDAQLKVELEQAEAALATATAAAEQGSADVERQRSVVRRTAVSIYTDGDPTLRALGNLAEAGSLEEVESIRLGDQVLSNQQTSVFDRLAAIEEQLAEEQAEVARTTAAVEAKKKEAADHLAAMNDLYAQSVAATREVQGLVGQARTARARAVAAKARDERELFALKKRERGIQARLEALARAQRDQVGYRGQSDGYLDYPVDAPVTSPYGYRTHPIYGYYSLHNGTDFGVACGTPLRAVAGGTVIDTYYDSVYGNRLFLSLGKVNGDSLVVVYNHLSSSSVGEGAKVARGTVIARSGTTGWSTGCHLHFTVMKNGTAVDPMQYL
ncbi:M23 family metallopeptidase [Nocardioides litoris]|uniref:M23 family metallopeptidase n=1 Tax=Nocardioides litoris TaxID=1926648 RepID=UPI001477669D|nr:M23 family metallopeptidase [Nocardioides litoris]